MATIADFPQALGRRGSVRRPRLDAWDPLEATLAQITGTWGELHRFKNTSGDPLRLELVISDDPGDAALCAHIGSVHWVVISQSLLNRIDDCFASLASVSNGHPLFLSGNAFLAEKLGHFPGFGRQTQGPARPLTPPLASAAPVNALLAGYLAHVALRFVLDHELLHAAHGHVLLVEAFFDRPIDKASWRTASPYERDLRKALEIAADRAALFQRLQDILLGAPPGNDAFDALDLTDKLALSVVAIAIVVGLWSVDESLAGGPDDAHPCAESRLYSLLEPGLAQALATLGLSQADRNAINRTVGDAISSLCGLHSVFHPMAAALDDHRRDWHRIETMRLENAYDLYAAPHLAARHFAPG